VQFSSQKATTLHLFTARLSPYQKGGLKMRVGVPTEIKNREYRVGLVPESVAELTARGHTVMMQSGAGTGIGCSDEDYRAVGAEIAPDAKAVFASSEMIVKVKEPQKSEWKQLREDQILFTYLHLAPDPAQTLGLMDSGCTAIAYETVTDAQGGLPLLAPMSEVAGRLSILEGGYYLKKTAGGRGLLLSGVPGTDPANIVIIGGGVVGTNAAKLAVGLGANVTILDRSVARLRYLDDIFGGRLSTKYSTGKALADALTTADLIIGAVLIPGAAAPRLVRREHLATMRPGAVLCDVAIDQGGCFETSKATTHEDPIYDVDGITHYCVANMPGAVPLTSSHALNNATLPFTIALADKGVKALDDDVHLMAGLNVRGGEIIHPAVIEALGKKPKLSA
jgi:alanine dehydrogenase